MPAQHRVFTFRQLRDRFSELVLAEDRPLMVTRNGIPLGFFIPARTWKSTKESALSEYLVEIVLEHAEQKIEDVNTVIEGAPAMQGVSRMPVI